MTYVVDSVRAPSGRLAQGLAESTKESPQEHETVTAVTLDGQEIKGVALNEDNFSQMMEASERIHLFDRFQGLPKQVDLEIHFAKGGTVYSKEAKAQTKFMQNIELATAVSYSDNLREEVIRVMRERAEQGSYPGHALYGYRNNRETRNIERHPEK